VPELQINASMQFPRATTRARLYDLVHRPRLDYNRTRNRLPDRVAEDFPMTNRANRCRTTVRRLLAIICTLAAIPAAAQPPQKPSAPGWWLAMPEQVDPQILDWAKRFPDLVSLDKQPTLGGHTAYAITVTDPAVTAPKRCLLFSQPHAHEPASTAGMMDILAQLLDGKHLDGRPADLDRKKALAQTVLTFIPLGNPDGRARAPQPWWDGSTHSNDQFLEIAFGRGTDGKRFPRQGRWSSREQTSVVLGIVYEQINDHEYVEPNRDRESSFFKLVRGALDRGPCDLHVDLHQTEFIGSSHNAMMLLPYMQKDLPPEIQAKNRRAADAILQAWKAAGADIVPQAQPLGYGEDQIRYFRATWGDIYRSIPQVSVEIQNNNPRTPPADQLRLMDAAIKAAIELKEQTIEKEL
jgi:hypothetical protein